MVAAKDSNHYNRSQDRHQYSRSKNNTVQTIVDLIINVLLGVLIGQICKADYPASVSTLLEFAKPHQAL
jgi:F0F1-type ATP synthase assembly protein I